MQLFVSGKQAKVIDTYSIEQVGIPSLVLMERAAESVAKHMMLTLQKEDVILAVCGTGNNGADAIAALRILFLEGYQKVSILYLGKEEKASEEWKVQSNIVRKLGIPLIPYEEQAILNWNRQNKSAKHFIVDGIFGIGLCRAVAGMYEKAIQEINASAANVIAVDIASGIDSNTGAVLNAAVRANETITFGFIKTGCMFLPGAEYSGNISCYSIGFAKVNFPKEETVLALEQSDIKNRIKARNPWGHKGTFGKVLIVAGSKGMAGAAYLSALAAYRMGAGLVRIFTVEENRAILQVLIPEAVMTTYEAERFCEEQVKEVLQWADAVVVGPGLGTQSSAENLLHVILTNIQVPFVLDADGLNILSKHSDWVIPENLGILTPHMGEMSRLSGESVSKLRENAIFYGTKLAEEKSAVVVEKDWRTLICSAGKETYLNLTGTNGMGTGGSGDVLTGILGALLAFHTEEQSLQEIAAIGVWIHGKAGEEACKEKGARSMTASDLICGISTVMQKIEE